MNRAQGRGGLNRSWLPRGGRLIAVALSAAVALAAGMVVAAPARAAIPSADAEYAVGAYPVSIAVNSAGTIAVTVNAMDNTASVIDLVTGDDSTVALDVQDYWLARDVAVDPLGTYAYVTNFNSGSISRIDLSDNSVRQIPVYGNPTRIAIDPAGVYAYVTVGAVADRITLSDLTVDRSFLSPVTGPLIITSDGATIYSYGPTATRFDAVSGNDTATFFTNAGNVTGAGFNANQTAIYGVNSDGWIRRTGLATGSTGVWVGNGPNTGTNSNSWVSVGNYAYVPVINDGTLKRVDLRIPNAFTTFASDLSGPSDVAVPANGTFILVASSGGDKVFKYTLPPPPTPPTPTTPPGDGSRALVWGKGGDGALGSGSTSTEGAPVQMAAGANAVNTWGSNWNSMDGGYDQTCGVGADRRAYCWGQNDSGQLGDGSTDDTNVPVLVAPGANTGNMWLSVSAGSNYSSCGVGTDAKAYCWGLNGADGQLGDGSTSNSDVPVAVVGGPESWSSVRVGNTHACGMGTDDEAYCWGDNGFGQLGDGTTDDTNVPVQVVGGPARWTQVSAGTEHTCGISTDSKAYCWGKNDAGELGIGSLDDTVVPVQVENGDNPDGTWDSIVAGYYATCGIGGDDKAYCWGLNEFGQLGDGTTDDTNVPVKVDLPAGVGARMLSMDAWGQHVCALSTSNVVYCWGLNGDGQLGDSTYTNSDVPVEVDLNAAPSANLAAGTPRMVAVGSSISLMVSEFGTAPAFTAASPPSTGTVGAAYSTYTFTASGSTPITFARASGSLPPGLTLASNGVLSGTPTTSGTYTFTVSASNGVNPDATTSPITITITSSSNTTPVWPPSAPGEAPGVVSAVSAVAGDGQVTVSWTAPGNPGSDPVNRYVVTASPGGKTCTVTVPNTLPPTAPATSCTVTGLTNGVAYTFTVQAGSLAGLGLPSSPSMAVTPSPTPTPPPPATVTIQVTGTRDGSAVRVTGTTTGLGMGSLVTPSARTMPARAYRAGNSVAVSTSGTFTWSRKVNPRKTLWVYFTADGTTSNTLTFRPR